MGELAPATAWVAIEVFTTAGGLGEWEDAISVVFFDGRSEPVIIAGIRIAGELKDRITAREQLAWLASSAAAYHVIEFHRHDIYCCASHGTHGNPHRGCPEAV